MKDDSSEVHPVGMAVVVLIILLSFTLILTRIVFIPEQYRGITILGALCAISVLVAFIVYQYKKTYSIARILATRITKDTLTHSHELFLELYRSSPVPYVVIDADGYIESINFSTARLFGVEMNALNKLDVFTFIGGEDTTKIDLIPEYFKQGKFINDVSAYIRRPDGTIRWVMLSLFSFTDSKNERKGLLTLVDITKQKMVDKAKTEFVSLASHQLRTPISGMRWNVELLMTSSKEQLTELQAKYMDKISHSLERMDMLVNDFLNVSKLELGTLTPTIATVEVISFLETIRDEHAVGASKKNIRLDAIFDEHIGTIQSDSHLLHMVISNLLSNAIKYTKENGTVILKAILDAEHLVITVTDTGMGIPLEDQDMIFSKMFRASNAREQVTDGTGLGLYIVKEAAEIIGGKISFESQEGVGTTFTVTLPYSNS